MQLVERRDLQLAGISRRPACRPVARARRRAVLAETPGTPRVRAGPGIDSLESGERSKTGHPCRGSPFRFDGPASTAQSAESRVDACYALTRFDELPGKLPLPPAGCPVSRRRIVATPGQPRRQENRTAATAARPRCQLPAPAIARKNLCPRAAHRLGRSASARTSASRSRCRRSRAFTSWDNSRSLRHCPPLSALRLDRALPASLRGPVDCCHGFQRRIASACRARRSGVQPLTIARPQ